MKPGGSSGRLHALRFESQRFRLLTIVVGCFLISLTFLLSSRPDATVFSTRMFFFFLLSLSFSDIIIDLTVQSSRSLNCKFNMRLHLQ